ncbi:MAG: urea ABC transporter permease subunit UrtC, partial [Opitutales bacterium]
SLMDRTKAHRPTLIMAFVGGIIIPSLYAMGYISIETVNMLGRYMTYAIVAVGLDLLWGYVGILSLCQATFFCLGTYAMGMYLAHHGGPEGIVDANGWKLPACLYVVYPYEVGEASGDALVPWFWKPFWNLPVTLLLGLIIPAAAAFALGYFVFRSRVRGVYFAILSQAIAVATWLVFCRNDVKLCGTNGLTRFDKIASSDSIFTVSPVKTGLPAADAGFSLAEPNVQLTLSVLTVFALLASYFLCRWIVRSRLGRVLVAIRDDETTLRFFGYRPYVYKLFAFCVAAALAGLGGMLYSPQMKITTPADMEAVKSVLIVVWVAVGGRGTLSGAILGALVVNLLYNYFTSEHDLILFTWKADYWQFILGGLFVAVVLFFPRGLMSLPEKVGLSQKIANLWSKLIHGRHS